MKKQNRPMVPVFSSEAEEAAWWFKNRAAHGVGLAGAAEKGEAKVMTRSALLDRIAASEKKAAPVVSLRIPEADLALARKQAERKGLPYQTYIKSLLHETLMEREKRRAG